MYTNRSFWVGFILSVMCVGCAGRIPSHLGLKEGRLVPCPDKPNCVSSFDTEKEHAVNPIPFSGDVKNTMDRLVTVISSHERTKVVEKSETYLHAEYTSLIFRFVDDVELFIDEDKGVIHIKSASRVGHSDLGVNRKRVERIRTDFLK